MITQPSQKIDWNNYYSPDQAAERLSANSGKPITKDYLRSLVRYGVLHPQKLGNMNMYPKVEVDTYVVEERGEKLKSERRGARKKKAG